MNKRKLNNPFALGGVARGKQFAGRANELTRLRALAYSGQRVFLFAPRRYGKTSLLREAFEPEAYARRIVLLWCDCLPSTDTETLTQRIAEPVVRAAARSRLAEWAKAATSLFKRLRPKLTVGPGEQVTVGIELAEPGAPKPADIEDALAAVGRMAASQQKPAVFVFDEFQQIGAWDLDRQTEAAIRTAIQDQPGVSYIFAGSQQHLLQAMFSERARPLYKLAVPFPLDRLTEDELRPWLEARFSETGLELEPAAVDTVLRFGAGHPWASQYLAHFVWDSAAARGGHLLSVDTVHDGVEAALEASDTIYNSDFATLTPSQRRMLMAVAKEPTESPTAAAYLRKHRLPAKSTVSQALRSLVEKGFVEKQHGKYLVGDPLFGEWIRRQ